MRDRLVNERLKLLLHSSGMKQTELAARTGMKYQNIHRAINGKRPIYADELAQLAAALGTSAAALLGLEG